MCLNYFEKLSISTIFIFVFFSSLFRFQFQFHSSFEMEDLSDVLTRKRNVI